MSFDSYLSPFSWRYGSEEMRQIWSETHKRLLWRQIWFTLAEVQSKFGLVTQEQVDDLKASARDVDIERALEIEGQIHHDLMAEIKTYAEQSQIGGGIIHLGATSMDIEDNAEALRMRASLDILIEKTSKLLQTLAEKIEEWADLPIIALTHIQPAEPSTLGYRLAQYAQDLLTDWEELTRLRGDLRAKGFKGAVGTSASFAELIGLENLPEFEFRLSQLLEFPFYPVTTQTAPRKGEYQIISAIAGLGGSLYKFAFDLRILQSPEFGELSEPFKKNQVGSSAMPFKRNPINAEKINSLGRSLAQMPRLAWDNAAHSLLERTLDDSANRRTMLPETFLICDELLQVTLAIIQGLQVNQPGIKRNLETYGPFAATERVLMNLVKNGADRQEMHDRIRTHTLAAWEKIQMGEPNPLLDTMKADKEFQNFLTIHQIEKLMYAGDYIGDAPQRAKELTKQIKSILK